jgi:hypothetical protein
MNKPSNDQLAKLRSVITENLRKQRSGPKSVPYIDVAHTLTDVRAKQNHAIFGRRGCGKTLLLHDSVNGLPSDTKVIYLNCEDFKNHSFPNVLIEILDAVFRELESHLGGWFGRKKKSKQILSNIRVKLTDLRAKADEREQNIRHLTKYSSDDSSNIQLTTNNFSAGTKSGSSEASELEKTYTHSDDKVHDLNMWLPELKNNIRDFFTLSSTVKAVFIQVDDFYHLKRSDQPFLMDYLHRLCKDLPLYFKVATLRHASVLYADRNGQPTGAQERHDYQPINIDYTFTDFEKTESLNKKILNEFGKLAGINERMIADLFKGEGFKRLILAGGGVPRDCLSLFLEILEKVNQDGDGRIGKDDIRILSRAVFERRIEELKQDSEGADQDTLIKGIYVIRKFCIEKQSNVFLVSEQLMQQNDKLRELLYRLMDYRIIHSAATAITHKSKSGTFQAFVIDIGCYAHMRTLEGRFNEIDITNNQASERMRSGPILDDLAFQAFFQTAPTNIEQELIEAS